MEDTFLKVFVIVVSLLLSKDHNVFHDQDDGITVSMQDHEHVLLEEGAKLEQGEHAVAMELPHSNQEVPQSHHRLPRREGDTSDVQQITPSVKTTVLHEEQMSPVGEQNDFCQKAFAPDDQEIMDIDKDKWSLHMPKAGVTHEQVNVDQSGSTVDQNVSQGDTTQPEKPQSGQIDTHREHQVDQGLLIDQKIPTSSQKLTITEGKQSSDQEDTFSWYLWKTLSLISLFRVLKRFLRKGSELQRKTLRCLNISPRASNIDNKTLTSFHNQCVLVPPSYSWQTCEFVEGFVNDLLETVRNMSTAGSDMEITDFVGVGSLYEQWASRKNTMCDIHVPIIPPKPYSFEFELLKESRGSSTLQYCCKVKLVKGGDSSTTCPCSNSNLDDMLCLLHPDNKNDHVTESYINDLCQENSSYLSKTQLVNWFKTAIRKAWKEISHKYEFELMFQNRENPGSLKVRFRSGQVIGFSLTPVVRFKDSKVHLISYCSDRHLSAIFSDIHWPMCVTHHENALLQHITKMLPDNACHIHCLQILSFLHKHQTGLTGPCGLTSYHLKNALLHLLVSNPSSWDPEQMVERLKELLTFLQQKLKAKVLDHALVGNPLIPTEVGLPKELSIGKPINLFLPFLNNELYLKANRHLQEMIRNMPVLVYESVRNV